MAKWQEMYNVHNLRLAKGAFRIAISWDKAGFKVNCNGCVLKKRYEDLAQAKEAGYRLARKMAAEVICELEDMI